MLAPRISPSTARAITLGSAGITLLLALLLVLHTPRLNGPPYWVWPYMRLSAARTAAIVGAVAVQLAIVLCAAGRRNRSVALSLAVLAIGSLGVRIVTSCMLADSPGLSYAIEVTRDTHRTGSFTVAAALAGADWSLADFPTMMPDFPLHQVNKPPGPVLFHLAAIRLFGVTDRAALVASLVIGVLSALVVPLTYPFARAAGGSRRVAIHAAAVTSLLPGAIGFFPEFDPAYALFTLLMGLAWFRAVRTGSVGWAILLGCLVAATTLVAFHLFSVGLFLLPAGFVAASGPPRERLLRMVKAAAIAVAVSLTLLVTLWAIFGYDTWTVFRVATEQQHRLLDQFARKYRPYPQTIGWDWSDCALGVGYLPAILTCAVAAVGTRSSRTTQVSQAGLFCLLVIGIAGMIPGENARVWNFLFPLLAVPAGAWVAWRPDRERAIVYAALAIVCAAELSNLLFMPDLPVVTG